MRELRTLLAMVSPLPLHLGTVHDFENLLHKCEEKFNGTRPSVDPIQYETHYDPNLVSLHSVLHTVSIPYCTLFRSVGLGSVPWGLPHLVLVPYCIVVTTSCGSILHNYDSLDSILHGWDD